MCKNKTSFNVFFHIRYAYIIYQLAHQTEIQYQSGGNAWLFCKTKRAERSDIIKSVTQNIKSVTQII